VIKYENNCIGCDYCMQCGADHTPIYICDECGDEVNTLYKLEGQQLCSSCVLNSLPEVDEYDE
jgi:hypothetical protein